MSGMLRSSPAAALLWALLLAIAAPALGQEAVDPTVDRGDLEILLKQYDKTELKARADEWLGAVKRKIGEIGTARIAANKAEGDAKAGLEERIDTLSGERDALIERLEVVLAELTAKGGDASEFESFLGAIAEKKASRGIPDVKEAGKFVTAVLKWLKSRDGGIKWATNIALFVIIIIAFKVLAGILGGIVRKATARLRKTSELLRDFFVNTVHKVVFFIGLVVALGAIGINVGPFVATIGAIGFIIGFALQGTLSNFASGIMILMYRPYDIGNVVNVAGVTGTVAAMSLVSTTIKTADNQTVVVPNGTIWGDVITNITGNETRRVDMVFGIGYADDIAKAESVLAGILENENLVLPDPAPVIQVHELADSSVKLVVRPWAKTSNYWAVYWNVTRAVKERFDEEGISIPFPQRDVHLFQESPA